MVVRVMYTAIREDGRGGIRVVLAARRAMLTGVGQVVGKISESNAGCGWAAERKCVTWSTSMVSRTLYLRGSGTG